MHMKNICVCFCNMGMYFYHKYGMCVIKYMDLAGAYIDRTVSGGAICLIAKGP